MQVVSSGAVDVAACGYHSMMLKQDGSVWATGWNEYGQLGDGSTIDSVNYVKVVPSDAKAIAAGSRHSMMLKQDGSVWTTGYNEYGQLGDTSLTDSAVFLRVMSDGAEAVAAGAYHSMVIKQDGAIWAAGSNKYSQFGNGSTQSKQSFTRILASSCNGTHFNGPAISQMHAIMLHALGLPSHSCLFAQTCWFYPHSTSTSHSADEASEATVFGRDPTNDGRH